LQKKKILIFSDWFYPGYKAGGPIKSVTNLSLALQKKYDVYVFTSDTDINENIPYSSVISNTWSKPYINSNVQVYYCSKTNLNTNCIYKIICEVAPDSVYLNHMWSFWFVIQPLFVCYLRFRQIKIVLCPRGALFEGSMHYLNKYFKKRVLLLILKTLRIHKRIVFHSTTLNEKYTILKYFGEANIIIANNLPDFYQPKLHSITKFKGMLNMIFIARIVEIKNLKYILENLLLVKSTINFSIAGPIGDKNYWLSCLSIIDRMPPNIKVNYLGEVMPHEILTLLQNNHLYCLPTYNENFGHSIFESFVSGRPVLISDQTPWLNLNIKKAGWEIKLNSKDCLVPFIEEATEWDQIQFDIYCKGSWYIAHDFLNNPTIISDYNLLFN